MLGVGITKTLYVTVTRVLMKPNLAAYLRPVTCLRLTQTALYNFLRPAIHLRNSSLYMQISHLIDFGGLLTGEEQRAGKTFILRPTTAGLMV